MAELTLVIEPKFSLQLSQEEADGLLTLLGLGTEGSTLQALKLESVWRSLNDHNDVHLGRTKFVKLASLSGAD